MRKLAVAFIALISVLVVGAVSIAQTPTPTLEELDARVCALEDAVFAKPCVSPTTTTVPPPTTTTSTLPPTTTTTVPPPAGFPSRAEILAGARVAPSSGKMTSITGHWDFRPWFWITGERFPITTSGSNSGIVGGRYVGTFDRTLDWDAMHSGAVLLQRGSGYLVSYDLRAENVPDFYRPRPAIDGNLASQQASRWFLDGCYGSYIRDDAVENDQELTGTVNDCLFDGVHMGVSIGQSNTNPAAVTTITNDIFIFRPMPHVLASDGLGHAAFFKQLGAGKVVVKNTLICYTEQDVRGNLERMGRWMPGTYQNVTVVLGPGWTDAQAAAFPTVPAGVTVSRDWASCDAAANAWRSAH